MRGFVYALLVFVVLMPFKAEAKRNHPKRWYQDRWCVKYFDPSEVMISDIHDCVSDTHVIEFDFADHWYESIGESLHYAMQTGKKAGIVLIIENDGELKYWIKLNDTIKHYRLPIDTWYTSP